MLVTRGVPEAERSRPDDEHIGRTATERSVDRAIYVADRRGWQEEHMSRIGEDRPGPSAITYRHHVHEAHMVSMLISVASRS